MTYFDALILGIIEGITEFLPISSTGHLILSSQILGLSSTNFLKSFTIAIQVGAIAAVIVLYWRRFLFKKAIFLRVSAAFIPTALLGLILYKFVRTYLLDNLLVLIGTLFIGGIFLIIFELFHKEKNTATCDPTGISYKQAICIGIFQTIAFIPGVSRAAATIIGGLLIGITRRTIVEFSFLLAIPTMLAATGLDLLKNAGSFSFDQLTILSVGFLSAFLVAIFAIKFFLYIIQKHTFIGFGIYRIVVATLVYLIMMQGGSI